MGVVPSTPVRICFVCSGNICRSPTAEVVFNHLAGERGVAQEYVASSAGIGGWHVGDDMDKRSRRELEGAGYLVARHSARQFDAADFDDTDVVVALDASHEADLRRLANQAADPAAARDKVVLLRAFDPHLRPGEQPDVADPYYGDRDNFTTVLEQVARSCAGLLTALTADAAPLAEQPERPSR
jgi:protein-tyrosine phosphatase